MKDSGFPGGITALMATYIKRNHRQLKNAIDSIYENSVIPDQVLVICDGPVTPESMNVLEKYKENFENFHFLKLPKNAGLASALNWGLENITTTWVARCDDDDINAPNRFENQLQCLIQNPLAKIIGSNIVEVDEYGRYLAERQVPSNTTEIIKMLPARNPFNHMTVIYELALAKKVGYYPLLAYEDYGLWIKLLHQKVVAVNVQEPLVFASSGKDMYRRRGGLRIAKNEFILGQMMYKYGFNSLVGASLTALFRASSALAPAWIKKIFYSRFLRKPKN